MDQSVLDSFVSELMLQRDFSDKTDEEKTKIKNDAMERLDKNIGLAIFANLNEGQLTEVNKLIDDENTSEESFKDFFERAGINLEEVIKKEVMLFKEEFLGGEK